MEGMMLAKDVKFMALVFQGKKIIEKQYIYVICLVRRELINRFNISDNYVIIRQLPLVSIEPPRLIRMIDMIRMFPLEYMHLACLSIMKKLYLDIQYFDHSNKKLKPFYRHELDKRIQCLTQWTPYKFQRKSRKSVENI